MSNVILKDHHRDNEKPFDTIAEAKEKKNDLISLGADPKDLEIVQNGDKTPEGDASLASEPTVEAEETPTQDTTELPDNPPVDTDPLTWIPDEFQDTIDGTIAINRKGFEVLAHHYNISCETELVERSDETVIHKAKATTENGTVYTAYGEAHAKVDEQTQLVRLSDTRAFKRAVSRATGIGMVAVEELKNQL